MYGYFLHLYLEFALETAAIQTVLPSKVPEELITGETTSYQEPYLVAERVLRDMGNLGVQGELLDLMSLKVSLNQQESVTLSKSSLAYCHTQHNVVGDRRV